MSFRVYECFGPVGIWFVGEMRDGYYPVYCVESGAVKLISEDSDVWEDWGVAPEYVRKVMVEACGGDVEIERVLNSAWKLLA